MSDKNEGTLPGGVSVEVATDEFSKYFETLQKECSSAFGSKPKVGDVSQKTTEEIAFGDQMGQWQPAVTLSLKMTYVGPATAEQRMETPYLFTVAAIAAESCAKELAGSFLGGGADFSKQAQASGQLFDLAYRVEVKEEDPPANDPTQADDPLNPFGHLFE